MDIIISIYKRKYKIMINETDTVQELKNKILKNFPHNSHSIFYFLEQS